MQWWQQPFFQVALPVMVTFILATWYQAGRISDMTGRMSDLGDNLGKRIDDLRDGLGKRIDDLRNDMNTRFAAVENRLDKLEEKVEALQERIWR
ncbi:hypothetical protein SBA4_2330010 [Candidatus Sulfopaludibacter sp. SbA4]|nr:hypothetical protein SBA4_2330010 [Candidatus Sulfopaludibacter sp. SbA4]